MRASRVKSARRAGTNARLLLQALALALCLAASLQLARAQRDNDQDDFDDAGFDDSGYNSPRNHDAEGSQHNPSNYSPSSEEDLDDDDDVDESAQVAKIVSRGPRQLPAPASSIVLPLQLGSARNRRSIEQELDVEQAPARALIRKRRYSKKYIGPVYTYVKTDKHAHYKWGVKHKVGKHYGRK